MQREKFFSDEVATIAFGRELALVLKQSPNFGAVIYLTGELGAGKTTLCRGLMRGFSYDGAVKSPTYTIVEPYELSTVNVYHFDLYRLSVPEEFKYLGIDDYFKTENICLIEWASRGGAFVPKADLEIELNSLAGGRQSFCVSGSEKGRDILKRLFD